MSQDEGTEDQNDEWSTPPFEQIEREENTSEIVDQLRDLVPAAFSEGQFDPSSLAYLLGQDTIPDERYDFKWTGKQAALDEARHPSERTLKRDEERSFGSEDTENILVEGENLETMKILQQAYHRRVKMVYIDPPYNTGHDFIYRDDYQVDRAQYERDSDQRDEDGNRLVANPETDGRYHSNWLSMMYPRLFLARGLLRDDGAIFVSIDYHEYHNLRMLMNEIYGEDNYVATFVWKRRNPDARNSGGVSIDHEYIVVYQKTDDFQMKGEEKSYDGYTNEDDRGRWASKDMKNPKGKDERPRLHYTITDPETGHEFTDTWKYEKDTMDELIETSRVKFPSDPEGTPRRKLYTFEVEDTKPVSSWFEPTNTDLDVSTAEDEIDQTILTTGLTGAGTRELKELFGEAVYDFPKSAALVRKLVKHTVDEGDIVLDFFAGSGTTGHAVMEHNAREDYDNPVKYLLVQLDEELDEPRSGFEKLSEICRERLKRAADKIASDHDGQFDGGLQVFGLSESNFKRWRDPVGPDETEEAIQAELQSDYTGVDNKDAGLIELMLLEGFTPNANIETVTTSEDEEDGDDDETVWHRIAEDDAEIFVSFASSLTLDDITTLDPQPTQETPVICLDDALNDSEKDNIARAYSLKTV